MKVRVVGSGSMWSKYASASYMIDEDILVDMPNGMCKALLREGINPGVIKHVLLTHFHGDHYFDIPFYFLLKSRADNKDIHIYCSKEGKRKNQSLLKLAFPNAMKDVNKIINLKYTYAPSFKIYNYEVKKYLVFHGGMKPAYGYILKDKMRKVGFTGDTTICKNVEYMARECDYLFCDCMFIKSTRKHMGIDNIKYLSAKYPKCKFVVSHLEDDTRNELEKLNLKNVIVPYDNLEITI